MSSKTFYLFSMVGIIAIGLTCLSIFAYYANKSLDKIVAAEAEMNAQVGIQLIMPTGDTATVVNYEFLGENYILDNGTKVSRAFIDSRKIVKNDTAISVTGRSVEP